MITIKNHLLLAQQALSKANIETHEAELLLAFALDKPKSYLRAWPEHIVPASAANWFKQAIERRCKGEPIAYLTGEKEFWSLKLQVSPMTLIPRPETELLVETVLVLFPEKEGAYHFADLGTGSGAIALAIASKRPHATIIATDQSPEALAIAKQNAENHHLTNIQFLRGPWCQPLPDHLFDAILSNPPYLSEAEWPHFEAGLAYEPKSALVAGEDGLSDLKDIIETAKPHLKPGGYLLLEHGYQQAESVQNLLKMAGYQAIHTHNDLAGIARLTLGKRCAL